MLVGKDSLNSQPMSQESCINKFHHTQQKGREYVCEYPNDDPVDGGWTAWSKWSKGSRPCGKDGGRKTRKRYCINPRPANGGKKCEGKAKEIEEGCNKGIECGEYLPICLERAPR